MTSAVLEECGDEHEEVGAWAIFKALIAAWKASTVFLVISTPAHAGWELLPV